MLGGKTSGFHEVSSLEPDAIGENFGLLRDDRTIYFSRRGTEADIWMLTLDENPQ